MGEGDRPQELKRQADSMGAPLLIRETYLGTLRRYPIWEAKYRESEFNQPRWSSREGAGLPPVSLNKETRAII